MEVFLPVHLGPFTTATLLGPQQTLCTFWLISIRAQILLAGHVRKQLLFWWQRRVETYKFALEMHELIWLSFWLWNDQTKPIEQQQQLQQQQKWGANKVQQEVVAATTFTTAATFVVAVTRFAGLRNIHFLVLASSPAKSLTPLSWQVFPRLLLRLLLLLLRLYKCA